jgi:DNA-binding FadR family transcriptional regulator
MPTERELTAELGVSRSTLREALNRLGSAGLIEIPHGGTKRVLDWRDHAGLEVLSALVVTPEGEVDLKTVRAVTELRAVLTPDVARLAATRRSDEQAQRLVALADALDPAASLDALIVATLAWWTVLVHAADNLAYRLAYNTLRSTYREGRAVLQELIAEELRAAPRYREVSGAVLARDPARAEGACAALVALGTDALLAAIDHALPAASDPAPGAKP